MTRINHNRRRIMAEIGRRLREWEVEEAPAIPERIEPQETPEPEQEPVHEPSVPVPAREVGV
jgi:hypothetical protein